jgi:hypothetical protein
MLLKKLACVVSALSLMACSCFQTAAVTISSPEGSDSVDVKAKYSKGIVTDVYAVDIQWGAMEFEYTGAELKWNPETHKYEKQNEGKWSCEQGANEIKVLNHSNKPVNVSFAYSAATGFSEIQGTFDTTSTMLPAAIENSDPETAPSAVALLTLTGELSENITSITKIGNATVTLSPTADSGDASNGDLNVPSIGDNNSSGGDSPVFPSEAAGYIKLYSRQTEFASYSYQAEIFQQAPNTYIANMRADEVVAPDLGMDTEIYINGTRYYIYEKGNGYIFEAGSTVNLNTEFYPDADTSKRKATNIKAGKNYTLIITLNSDNKTGSATLAETTA